MDILNYPKQKARNGASIKRYGQSLEIEAAQFDAATGEALPPLRQVVTREQIQRDRDTCAERLAAYDELLSDIDKLA